MEKENGFSFRFCAYWQKIKEIFRGTLVIRLCGIYCIHPSGRELNIIHSEKLFLYHEMW